MKTFALALVTGMVGLAGIAGNANAQDSFAFSINLGGPAYYGPPPVYVVPPPVRYAPPPAVYYQPAPVYYGPREFVRYGDEPRRFYGHHDNGFHNGWHGHHGH